mgnify:FL=1
MQDLSKRCDVFWEGRGITRQWRRSWSSDNYLQSRTQNHRLRICIHSLEESKWIARNCHPGHLASPQQSSERLHPLWRRHIDMLSSFLNQETWAYSHDLLPFQMQHLPIYRKMMSGDIHNEKKNTSIDKSWGGTVSLINNEEKCSWCMMRKRIHD